MAENEATREDYARLPPVAADVGIETNSQSNRLGVAGVDTTAVAPATSAVDQTVAAFQSEPRATGEKNDSIADVDADADAKPTTITQRRASAGHRKTENDQSLDPTQSTSHKAKTEATNKRSSVGEVTETPTATKKKKVGDLSVSPDWHRKGDRTVHPSPVYIATGWPQRSPIDAAPPPSQGGVLHRCEAESNGSIHASSSTLSTSREHGHDDVAHALFTESFDTISACGSAMAVREQQLNAEGILSPRQKIHSPPRDGTEGILPSPRKKSRRDRYPSNGELTGSGDNDANGAARYGEYHLLSATNHKAGSSGLEHQPHGDQQYQEHSSPHSPPQRVVHVDGEDHGCEDISPIKFSPPTDSSPSNLSNHRGHYTQPSVDHRQRYRGGFPAGSDVRLSEDREFPYETSSPPDGHDEQHAAEISFDTSAAAGNSGYHHQTIRNSGDEGRRQYSLPVSHSPSHRGTGESRAVQEVEEEVDHENGKNTSTHEASIGGQHYDSNRERYYHDKRSFYSTAPPLPRGLPSPDLRDPRHYYHNHKSKFYPGEDVRPPLSGDGARYADKEVTKGRNDSSKNVLDRPSRMVQSSPIQSGRPRYPNWPQQELHYAPYGAPANTILPPPHPPFVGTPWTIRPPNSKQREPNPPRDHMAADTFYRNRHHQVDQYPPLPPYSQGETKRPSGAPFTQSTKLKADAAPPPSDNHKIYQQHSPFPPPTYSPYHNHRHDLAYVGKDPFTILRCIRTIFQGCSYLLYPVHVGINWSGEQQAIHTDPDDLKIARRRIESAICALGGYIKDVREGQYSCNGTSSHDTNGYSSKSSRSPTISSHIFRRTDGNQHIGSITGTSSSSSSDHYRDRFHNRYFIGNHGVSWEVEENPPVCISIDDDEDNVISRNGNNDKTDNSSGTVGNPSRSGMGNRHVPPLFNPKSPSLDTKRQTSGLTPVDHSQKMKYRCKLCGQPKQNHVCPYRKSLVRTIGVMVCPAVNAYTTSEPGVLTPALTEMNNVVPYARPHSRDDNSDIGTESSSRDHSSHGYRSTPGGQQKTSGRYHYSPTTSSLSTSPHSNNQQSSYLERHHHANLWQEEKRPIQQSATMPLVLRAEHYRVVTPRSPCQNTDPNRMDERDDKEEDSFDYPHVPLTYAGRKRLTDTLFYLSQRVPSVMTDVASLLRLARERDEWDLAVAEVLTQIIVCIHCSDGDFQLSGLCKYLLKIGTAS